MLQSLESRRSHCLKKKNSQKTASPRPTRKRNDEANAVGEWQCIYCGEAFVVSIDTWVQCSASNKWAHEECAGVDETDAGFVCDLCD